MFRSIAVRSFWFALGAPLLVAGAPSPESRATISPSLVRLAPGGIGLGRGSEAGQFADPRFATVDSGGKIYVTDVKGDRPRIQVFDRNGKFLKIFAEKGTGLGQILRGYGLSFDRTDRLFVTDVDNMRVSAFAPDGTFLFHWGKDGIKPGDFNVPHGLFMDSNDDVFVNGYYGPTQKFTFDGRFLLAFAYGDPQTDWCTSIASPATNGGTFS